MNFAFALMSDKWVRVHVSVLYGKKLARVIERILVKCVSAFSLALKVNARAMATDSEDLGLINERGKLANAVECLRDVQCENRSNLWGWS